MYNGGLYWISVLVNDWCICDIPHGSFYNRWVFAVAIPGHCEQNNQEIFLAINGGGDNCGGSGHRPAVFDLTAPVLFLFCHPGLDPGSRYNKPRAIGATSTNLGPGSVAGVTFFLSLRTKRGNPPLRLRRGLPAPRGGAGHGWLTSSTS